MPPKRAPGFHQRFPENRRCETLKKDTWKQRAESILSHLPQPKSWGAALLQLLVILVLSGFLTILFIKVAPNEFSYMVEQFTTQPLLLLLNFLPVFLVMVFFAALTGNVFYGAGITAFFWGALSLANRLKCDIRREPLYPRDLKLLREALAVTGGGSDIDLPMKIVAFLLATILGLFLLGFLLARLGKRPIGLRGLSRWLHCILSGVVGLVLVFTVYYSGTIYTSFTGGHFFHIMGAYNNFGFIYSFCHHITTSNVDKPNQYSEDEAAQWDSEDLGAAESKPVNVVILMNETFSNIVDYDVFTYPEDEDPIPFFHVMQEREDVVSGRLVVGNLGGGTANTEFDVMTGIQWDTLSEGTTVAFRTIDNPIDSIFRNFKAAGFLTSYIHPGNRWFYNRNHIIPRLGADSTIFLEDLEDPEILGNYVSDDCTANLLIDKFQLDNQDGDQLIFNYTTSIQNHMYYNEEKYGPDYPIPPLRCSAELSEETESMLAIYIEGLRYADKSLEKVVRYLETCGEPVLFVFYGDHLPYLGDDGIGYEELGLTSDTLSYDFSLYSTPYLIWANDEAKEILDWDNAVASAEISENLSACYMGATILELIGASDSSPWFTFLNQLRREYPVVWKGQYMNAQGEITLDLSDEDAALIAKWRKWAYYRMEGKFFPENE